MQAMETLLVTLAVVGALYYLLRRLARQLTGRSEGCCAHCSLAGRGKIRLAVGRAQVSIKHP
jgi:hypothetical protein